MTIILMYVEQITSIRSVPQLNPPFLTSITEDRHDHLAYIKIIIEVHVISIDHCFNTMFITIMIGHDIVAYNTL